MAWDDIVICPYCAYKAKLFNFRVRLKRGGYSRKMYMCKDCWKIMRKRTLTRDCTVEDWAEWLYVCIRMFRKPGEKFYDKISWVKLLKRLKEYGMSYKFWEKWKIVKATFDSYSKSRIDFILSGYSSDEIDLLTSEGIFYLEKQKKLV